ncbi:MAG: TIGR04197 family type VII secretion effector [Eubacterium sp.]|nr:TIGR04197 family type VII secretion effector [Eubacterium sp.]
MGIKSSKSEADAGGNMIATAAEGITDVSCSKDEMSTITAVKKAKEVWETLESTLNAYLGAVNMDTTNVSKLGSDWSEVDQALAGIFTIEEV